MQSIICFLFVVMAASSADVFDPCEPNLVANLEWALRRWGHANPAAAIEVMRCRWPGLIAADLQFDVLPRIAQLEFLLTEGALAMAVCARLVVEQPRVLSWYKVHVLLESDGLVAVNKPFDMRIDVPKRESKHWPEERTIADWFVEAHPDEKVRFCHQLDHATSGVMLMACTKAAGKLGGGFFEKRLARKSYLALVLGHPLWDEEHTLSHRLCDGDGFARRIAGEDEGESAETVVRVLKRGVWPASGSLSFADGSLSDSTDRPPIKVSLVEARLITGRRHQIRLHLFAEGHPILGDDTYEGHPWGQRGDTYRMFLHSFHLGLPLPSGDVEIEAPCDFADEIE